MMTENAASPSPVSPTSSTVEFPELKADDVLLGRGPGLSQFEGNLRFRALVDERKAEYTATTKRKEKKRIAKEIVDLVHAKGGRFLKQENASDNYNNVWFEADLNAAMEKTKQSLREIRSGTAGGRRREQEDATSEQSVSSSSSMSHVNATPLNFSAFTAWESRPSHERVRKRDAEPASLTPQIVGKEPESSVTEVPQNHTPGLAGSLFSAPTYPPLESASSIDSLAPVSPMSPALHAGSAETTGRTARVDPRLLLFRGIPYDFQQPPPMMIPQSLLMNQLLRSGLENGFSNIPPADIRTRHQILQDLLSSASVAAAASHQNYLANSAIHSIQSSTNVMSLEPTQGSKDTRSSSQDIHQGDVIIDKTNLEADDGDGSPATQLQTQASVPTIDDEPAAFLLSSLAVSDGPVITGEEEERERAEQSNEERAAALSDLFGRMCVHDTQQQKRARRDLDRFSIDFLIRQMRHELNKIPRNEKPALLEGQMKCRADEFSDARLEKFLRCEGMNTEVRVDPIIPLFSVQVQWLSYCLCISLQLAARRFVHYWESRRQVFGPEKYTKRMTLSEAVRDDLVALKAGVFNLLPKPDVSGRQMAYVALTRHTMDGYDSESLVSGSCRRVIVFCVTHHASK